MKRHRHKWMRYRSYAEGEPVDGGVLRCTVRGCRLTRAQPKQRDGRPCGCVRRYHGPVRMWLLRFRQHIDWFGWLEGRWVRLDAVDARMWRPRFWEKHEGMRGMGAPAFKRLQVPCRETPPHRLGWRCLRPRDFPKAQEWPLVWRAKYDEDVARGLYDDVEEGFEVWRLDVSGAA